MERITSTPPSERLARYALRLEGNIFTGVTLQEAWRHFDKAYPKHSRDGVEVGFILNSNGGFVDVEMAKLVAEESGQSIDFSVF